MLIKNAYQAFTLEGVNLDLNIKQPLIPSFIKHPNIQNKELKETSSRLRS